MRRLLLIALLLFAGWKGWQQVRPAVLSDPVAPARPAALAAAGPGPAAAPAFRCDGRQYCSQMRSRAEAEFFLRHCPDPRMDGDRDGIPCENDSRF